jgi:hypothetical protein
MLSQDRLFEVIEKIDNADEKNEHPAPLMRAPIATQLERSNPDGIL